MPHWGRYSIFFNKNCSNCSNCSNASYQLWENTATLSFFRRIIRHRITRATLNSCGLRVLTCPTWISQFYMGNHCAIYSYNVVVPTQGWSNVHFVDWFPMILHKKKCFWIVQSFIIWLWLHASAMKVYILYLYQDWLILLHFKPE